MLAEGASATKKRCLDRISKQSRSCLQLAGQLGEPVLAPLGLILVQICEYRLSVRKLSLLAGTNGVVVDG